MPTKVTSNTRMGMPYQRGEREGGAVGMSIAAIVLRSSLLDPIRSVSAKCVDRPGSSHHFARVHCTARNEKLLSFPYGNAMAANDQGVAPLHDNHVFIVIVGVGN